MSDPFYAAFDALQFSGPNDGVLEITISTPGKLNAVDAPKHLALADVWTAVDRDPDTRVVVVHGEGGAFSAGGDLEMIKEIAANFEARTRPYERPGTSSTT